MLLSLYCYGFKIDVHLQQTIAILYTVQQAGMTEVKLEDQATRQSLFKDLVCCGGCGYE